MKFFKKAKRGFTLVELVVVIAVIAILAAVSVGAYFGITDSANKSKLESEARGVHTNIQLIAQNGSTEWNIDRNGLYIKDLDSFEAKLLEYSGIEYDVKAGGEVTTIANSTIYFFNKAPESSERLVKERFNSFKYYSPEVGNKRASVDIVSGEVTIEDVTFNVGEPEPVVVNSINFADIEDEINLIVTNTQTFSVVSDPEDISYEFEIGNESVISVSNNTITALSEGTSTLKVVSTDDETKFDSITVNVEKVKINETLIVEGLNTFKKAYIEGQPIDTEGLTYFVTYNKGERKEVEATVFPTVLSTSDTTVTFTYVEDGCTASYTVTGITVSPKSLQNISANVQTLSSEGYFAGDTYVLSGITFKAHYDNGESHDISYDEIDFDSTLEVNQGSIEFSYPKGSENPKTLVINFDQSIPAIELTSFEVTTTESSKTVYEVGETPTKENLNFSAYYNKNPSTPKPVDINNVNIVTTEITAETEYIEYSFTDGEITKSDTLPIKVTDHETYYFVDQNWWGNSGSKPHLTLYNSNNHIIENSTKVMTAVSGTYSPLTKNQVWETSIDIKGASYLRVSRHNPEDGSYTDAATDLISISSLGENNLIILENEMKWYHDGVNDSTKTTDFVEVSFDSFVPNETVREYHLLGLSDSAEDWAPSEDNKFSYDEETKKYTYAGAEMEYHDEFYFYESKFKTGVIKYEDLILKFASTKGFSQGKTHSANVVVGKLATGKNTITIDSNNIISFEMTENMLELELRGVFESTNRWTTNPKAYTSRTGNVFLFNDVKLNCGDEFQVYLNGRSSEDFLYTYTNVKTKPSNTFCSRGDGQNIYLYNNDGVYDIKVDIENDSITIEKVSATNKVFYLSVGVWGNNARYAAYFCNGTSTAQFTNMTKAGNYYKVIMPDGNFKDIIFCRMNNSNTTNNWNNVWNQTADLTISSISNYGNLYSISGWNNGTDGKSGGSWSKISF